MNNREKIYTVFAYFGKLGLEILKVEVYNKPYNWWSIELRGVGFLD